MRGIHLQKSFGQSGTEGVPPEMMKMQPRIPPLRPPRRTPVGMTPGWECQRWGRVDYFHSSPKQRRPSVPEAADVPRRFTGQFMPPGLVWPPNIIRIFWISQMRVLRLRPPGADFAQDDNF